MPTPEQFDLNVIPNGIVPVCHVSQYDESREIRINLFYGDVPYAILGGTEAVIAVRKEDGHIVTVAATYTASQSNVTFKTTKQMCAVAGKNICELQLIQRSGQTILEKLGSLNFIMMVEKCPIDGGITSASEIHDLEQQIADITTQQMGNYYTKAESDARYLTTADVYTKSQIDDVVNEINYNKADKSDVYTKDDVDGFLATKADSDDVYTKDEVDEIADSKLDTNEFTKRIFSKADKSSVYYVEDKLVLSHSANDAMIVVTDSGSSTSYVNVRTDPDTEAMVIGQLYENECFIPEEIVTGESIDGNSDWAKLKIRVQSYNLTGYVACRYLRNRNMVEFNNPGISNIPYKIINIDVLTKVCGISGISTNTPIYGWDKIKIYKNNSLPTEIELPETMWGGTIRISNLYSNESPLGKARVIWTQNKAGCKLKDVSSWSYTDGIFVGVMDYSYFDSSEATTEILCGKYSSYTDGDISNAPDGSIFNVDDTHVGIKDSSITSLDDFLSYINNQSSINNHTSWISYPDPVGDGGAFEIDSILFYDGDNYIYTDCGNTVGCTVEINSDVKTKIEGLTEDLYNLNTLSGSVVSFNTSLEMPLKSLEANITAQQESGTPSPASPKAITGFSSINLVHEGKNLMPSLFEGTRTSNGITYTVNEDGTVNISGNVGTYTNSVQNYGHCVLPAGTYTLTGIPTTSSTSQRDTAIVLAKNAYSGSVNVIVSLYSNASSNYATFTLTEATDCYLRLYCYPIAGTYPPNTVFKPMIVVGSTTDGNYEACRQESKTVALGGTYYGGLVDIKNGIKTVTRVGYDLKNYTGSVVKVGSGSSTYFRFDDLTPYPNTRAGYFMISDKYEKTSITTSTTTVGVSAGKPSTVDHTTIFFRPENPDTYTTETIMDYIRNTLGGVFIVYDLYTPITTSGLTPDNLTTISGENTIFADSGDVSISFYTKEEDGVIIGTLSSGSTSITLYNSLIKSDSTLDIYTNIYGVNPTGVTVTDGSITLTFEAQESDLGVKVVIK